MAERPDISAGLNELAAAHRGLKCRGRDSRGTEERISKLAAADRWLICLSGKEIDDWIEREVKNPQAGEWFRRRLYEGHDSLVACARRELSLLQARGSGWEETLGAAARRLLRLIEQFLREYERRRGRRLSKWSPGFGEVSTSLALEGNEFLVHEHRGGLWGTRVYKRMPVFPDKEAAERYRKIYFDYDKLLREEAGLELPPSGVEILHRGSQGVLVFVWQLQLAADTIGPVVLRRLGKEQALLLFDLVIDQLRRLFEANDRLQAANLTVGLDGQITNWAIPSCASGRQLDTGARLVFLDTNTPLIRKDGKEMLDTEIFLKALSPMLRPVVRHFFLQKILDRYYDPRTIILDFLGNTVVQGRGDLVEHFVRRVDERRMTDLDQFGISPISTADVERYVREDVFTWRLVRTARALEDAVSAALRAEAGAAWEGLKQVKRIWTSALFDVRDKEEEPSNANALD